MKFKEIEISQIVNYEDGENRLTGTTRSFSNPFKILINLNNVIMIIPYQNTEFYRVCFVDGNSELVINKKQFEILSNLI